MKAELIFREKQTLDGYIREMIIWRLHKEGAELPYLFRSLEATFADFLTEIAKVIEKERNTE